MHIEKSNITMRLAKFMGRAGIASRRKSEELIKAGKIAVNGKVVESPATNIKPAQDTVTYKGREVSLDPLRYFALNKPPGYTCSAKDPHADKLISELFPADAPRLFTVGRLDRDSEGLIICTNDGDFAEQVAHPRHQIPKVYHVEIRGEVTPQALQRLKQGIIDEGERLVAQEAAILKKTGKVTRLKIVLNEGRKREIRRLCQASGWQVKCLVRTAIGPLQLGKLKPGAFRPLEIAERDALAALACR